MTHETTHAIEPVTGTEHTPISNPQNAEHGCGEKIDEWGSSAWYFDLCVAVFCCSFSGLMSGLTVGMTSLDHISLEI